MKKNLIWLIVAAAIIIGGVYFYTTQKNSDKEDDVIKIGAILPLTGDFASYGIDCKNGIEYALSQILTGEKYEIIYEDSRGEPKNAINSFNKLVNADKVKLIIGDMFSNTTGAIAPLANSNKVLLISPTASSKDIAAQGIYSLSVFPSEDFEAKLIANYSNNSFKSVGVLYESVSAAEDMKDAFNKSFKGQVLFNESFNSKTANFRTTLTKLKAFNVDAIYLISYTNSAEKVIQQMSELKWNPTVLGQSALFDPSLIPTLKKSKINFVLTGPMFSQENTDSTSMLFQKAYLTKFSKAPNQMAAQGFIATNVALDFYKAIKKREYDRNFILGYKKNIFGQTFEFDKDLTSQTGLVLYKFEGNDFHLLK